MSTVLWGDYHRKRYMGPFAFLLLMVGVQTLVVQASDFVVVQAGQDSSGVAQLIQRHMNLMMLLQVPVLSVMLRVLFRNHQFNLAEHAVLASYLSGFRALFFVVVSLPLWKILMAINPDLRGGGFSFTMIVVWAIYVGFASNQFYKEQGSAKWRFCKGVVATFAAQLTVILLITIPAVVYMKLMST